MSLVWFLEWPLRRGCCNKFYDVGLFSGSRWMQAFIKDSMLSEHDGISGRLSGLPIILSTVFASLLRLDQGGRPVTIS